MFSVLFDRCIYIVCLLTSWGYLSHEKFYKEHSKQSSHGLASMDAIEFINCNTCKSRPMP